MISTHILDTSLGIPAQGVTVSLDKQDGDKWSSVDSAKTNNDGRITFKCENFSGIYRLSFNIGEYFKAKKVEAFFVTAPVVFNVTDTNRRYHIPLLLSPYGYSTYRGS